MGLGRLINVALTVSGLMVLAIGLAHFAMPSLGYAPEVIAAVPDAQRDHFVYLGTYAIGTFLVSFGVMTMLVDPMRADGMHRAFLGLMVMVWGARIVLEVIYPVTLSLFFVSHPHPALIVALLVIWAGYALAFVVSLLRGRENLSAV